jgi:hypothetical protein
MYPEAELIALDECKARVRLAISVRRHESAAAAATLSRPLEWLDGAQRLWRSFAPLTKLAAWPLASAAVRVAFPRSGRLQTLLRWAPAILGAVSAYRRMRQDVPQSPAGL